MEIRVRKIDRGAIVRLSGRLDMNSSPDLRKTVFKLCSRGRCDNLTIDFKDVSFIDTSGLATLVEILVAISDQWGQLTLFDLNEKVQYLIDVNGLTGFFRIETSSRERVLT